MRKEATTIKLSEEQRSELERHVRWQRVGARKPAAKMGVFDTTVHKVWKANGLKPHLLTVKLNRRE